MEKDISVRWEINNSDTCSYFISQKISESAVNYTDSLSANRSPIATKIFGFPWTKSVEVTPNQIKISKHDWVEWDVLAEPLAGLIKEHVNEKAAKGTVEENPEISNHEITHELAEPIQALFDNEINPAVASHGGYIRLVDIKDNKILISMEGGCQGCAQSQATLREGVVTAVKKYFPQIQDVVDVTNHADGHNPYFSA
jgi:Fe-S cluster biogenesis protein NfuA